MDAVKLIGCLGHSRTLQSFCVCMSLREMQHSAFPTLSDQRIFIS